MACCVHTNHMMKPEELKRHLRRLDLSAAELAEELGVHRTTVQRWMHGHTPMPVATAKLIRTLQPEVVKA